MLLAPSLTWHHYLTLERTSQERLLWKEASVFSFRFVSLDFGQGPFSRLSTEATYEYCDDVHSRA